MAIPGSKPKIEPTAKIRIGEKRTSAKGNSYPAAVDYFRSDDPAVAQLVGEKPKTLTIRLLHETTDEAFSSGLEWWAKKKGGGQTFLACYTKDGGSDPIALRMEPMVNEGDTVRGEKRGGQGRVPISCLARECPVMKKGDCKPMARLVFELAEDPEHRVYQIDTKAWNSIERITGALLQAEKKGSLEGRTFLLSVEIVKKGGDSYPVMSLEEVTPEIRNIEAELGREKVREARENGASDPRALLALYFLHARPGCMDDAEWVEKFKARLAQTTYDAALAAVMGE